MDTSVSHDSAKHDTQRSGETQCVHPLRRSPQNHFKFSRSCSTPPFKHSNSFSLKKNTLAVAVQFDEHVHPSMFSSRMQECPPNVLLKQASMLHVTAHNISPNVYGLMYVSIGMLSRTEFVYKTQHTAWTTVAPGVAMITEVPIQEQPQILRVSFQPIMTFGPQADATEIIDQEVVVEVAIGASEQQVQCSAMTIAVKKGGKPCMLQA
jgi:hypothetical protein